MPISPALAADSLALMHVSRSFGHCTAFLSCLVCGRGISSCSMLKYWLEHEKQEVLGCCIVWKSSWRTHFRARLSGWLAPGGSWGGCSNCQLSGFLSLSSPTSTFSIIAADCQPWLIPRPHAARPDSFTRWGGRPPGPRPVTGWTYDENEEAPMPLLSACQPMEVRYREH